MKLPDFKFENPLWKSGYQVIGIDEVGRGAFAGPVGVGAVMFLSNLKPKEKNYLLSLGINDSKKLSPKRRLELSHILKQLCTYTVEFVDVDTINEIGVGKATFLGMQRVFDMIASSQAPRNDKLCALVDGFEIPGLKTLQKGIIHGDSLSISIAAASIIAKVERDRLMEHLSLQNIKYGFERNKGYGTLFHREALMQFGSTDHHRTDFVVRYVS